MEKRVRNRGSATERGILVTDYDSVRLETLLRRASADGCHQAHYLSALARELGRAKVVQRDKIPPGVVTMNSTVRFRDLETGEDETYTLVYPEQADVADNRLSVLAPVGTALLGYRVGDIVEWPVPAGVRRLRVEEVLHQPAGVLEQPAG